jgi:hypothetical protein
MLEKRLDCTVNVKHFFVQVCDEEQNDYHFEKTHTKRHSITPQRGHASTHQIKRQNE